MTLFYLLGLGCAAHGASPPAPPAAQAAPVSLAQLELVQLDGTPLPAEALEGQVVLFVNVASKCGYTPQYDGLQALYEAKKEQGLVIVGVPCNQFGKQEPGSAEEISSFCRINYGVDFPLLEKQDVNGDARSALYAWLIGSEAGGGDKVKWNFEKFLVGRDGQVIARFRSNVAPDDPALVGAIEAAL